MQLEEIVKDIMKTIEAKVSQAVAAATDALEERIKGMEAHGLKRSDFDEELKALQEVLYSAMAQLPVAKDGAPGADGTNGKDGIDGTAGRDGQDGTNGKDALQIEILSAIDEAKEYPRGTYATHKGGLWRSFQRTEGLKGWECIVDSTSLAVEYDGERGVTITTEKASGKVETKNYTMPIIIDRGVFKEGEEYKQFDAVTYGGSLFIVQKESPEGRPGTSDDFRLAVKRGRDANQPVKVKK